MTGAKLIVAGEFYEDRAPYDKIISEKKLQDRVILKTDFIPDANVANYFCASDLIVQPYTSATQSGVTQIAYNFRIPMLVTDVGGLKEIVPPGKAGYVVKPEVGEIADAISDFYSQGGRDKFSEGIEEERKKYEWSRMTSTIESLYDNMTKTEL